MEPATLNDRIIACGKDFFESIRGEQPSLFNKGRWIGNVLDWCMRNEAFKVQLFRFVDVFPTLASGEALSRHLQEYFAGGEEEVPAILRWGAKGAGLGGALGTALLAKVIRGQIEELARQFIAGESPAEAARTLSRLRREGFACTVDLLGEATVSEAEADRYRDGVLALLSALGAAQQKWAPLGEAEKGALDWGHAPLLNVSVKPSALSSRVTPMDFEGSVTRILSRLGPLFRRVRELGGFLCIDMESHQVKEITLEVYRRLRLEHRDDPHLGIALQSYLRETDEDLEGLLAWARREKTPLSVRLVKGAYWDFETVRARQNGWPVPVYTEKEQTDAAFERQARLILENHDIYHLACGSHNVRSIAAVLETARELGVPEERYEFQVLYGMAEPVRKGLLKKAGRIRLYAPCGAMVPGMAYLVRRLLENTANESFLRQSFAEGAELDGLLEDPASKVSKVEKVEDSMDRGPGGELPPFANEAAADFTRPELREAFSEAIPAIRNRLGGIVPLHIGGRDVTTSEVAESVNPAAPGEVVGRVCQAGPAELEAAVAAAAKAFPAWRDTPAEARAAILVKGAAEARRRLVELAAWQVLEIGKQWDQAHADVAEAIDFLEYYAREAIRLSSPRRLGSAPGELNHYLYEPRGVAAVIAPWNFPLAISCGMSAAALAAGNSVVYKPSGLTPVVGRQLVEIFLAAGLPPGVFNYLPGKGGVIGEKLVGHPGVSLVAFTGSAEVGLGILEKAPRVAPGQAYVKRVVAEMGGKNAIIVDDDADLDEAVPAILASAFGFQGQKCSACSRVIVLDAVYDPFVKRLVEGARSLAIGPAEDPANTLGPVADGAQRDKILRYLELAAEEGEILYRCEVPDGEGFYVPLALVGGITPEHRLAREEIFGPILAILRARDFDQALEWANDCPYALTGGLFSRSPDHLARARTEFRVGNLYLNRGITGALVERQPFGGARLSGVGSKAGGPDYLLQFLDPRTVTENTLRRGFAPAEE